MDSLTICLDILIFCHLQLDCVHVSVWWGGWGKIGSEGGRERERGGKRRKMRKGRKGKRRKNEGGRLKKNEGQERGVNG